MSYPGCGLHLEHQNTAQSTQPQAPSSYIDLHIKSLLVHIYMFCKAKDMFCRMQYGVRRGGASAGPCWGIPPPWGTSHILAFIRGPGKGVEKGIEIEREEREGEIGNKESERENSQNEQRRQAKMFLFYSKPGLPGCCYVTVGQSLERMLTC